MKKNQLCFLCIPHAWGERLGTFLGCITPHLEETCWHYKATNVRLAFTSPVVFPPSSPSMFVCVNMSKN